MITFRTTGVTLAMTAGALLYVTQQPSAQRTPQVHTVAAQQTQKNPSDLGATYYHIEARARTVTSYFADGSAVAERGFDGDVRTRYSDRSGNVIARLTVDLHTRQTTRLSFADSEGREKLGVTAGADTHATLEWANRQLRAYRLDAEPAVVVWQGELARRPGVLVGNLDDQLLEVVAEFDGSVTARSTRDVSPGVNGARATWQTTVSVDGMEVGKVVWSQSHRVLGWKFPGLTQGYVNDERLAQAGGFPQTPTMGWSLVQGLLFYESHKRLKEKGPEANAGGSRGLLRTVSDWLVAPLHAQNGCDYMHYLDDGVLRPCCDRHDQCYSANGCTMSTWWHWGQWSCNFCNTVVVFCFFTNTYFCDEYFFLIFGWC